MAPDDQRTIVETLLRHPNFQPSPNARADLESGAVDPRLIAVLVALVAHHTIAVSLIKTGHPLGPRTPSGRPNAHYFYRVADISAVDNTPVRGHGSDPALVDVGRLLYAIAPQLRPDQIMGPREWHTALGYSEQAGFRSDAVHTAIHTDHLHVGFSSTRGTSNQE